MALVNFAKREVNIKIVYYGPASSGKETNLQFIHQKLNPKQRGKLIRLALEPDTTLFFDFMPVNLGEVKGFKTTFHIYTIPGDIKDDETKKALLKGVDGLVFIADSQQQMMNANAARLKDLEENIRAFGRELSDIPLVIQYNKRDLEDLAGIEQLHRALNPGNKMAIEATAINGKGVLETFTNISKMAMQKIREKPTLMNEERAEEDELLNRLMKTQGGEVPVVTKAASPAPSVAVEEKVEAAPGVAVGQGEEETAPALDRPLDRFAFDAGETEMETPEETSAEESAIEAEPVPEDMGQAFMEEETTETILAAAPAEESLEGEAGLPEGVEMEPGFELGDEEISILGEEVEAAGVEEYPSEPEMGGIETGIEVPELDEEAVSFETESVGLAVGDEETVSTEVEGIELSKFEEPAPVAEEAAEAPEAASLSVAVEEGGVGKVTFGVPETRGSGRFTIPVLIGSREFNLNLSMSLEEVNKEETMKELFAERAAPVDFEEAEEPGTVGPEIVVEEEVSESEEAAAGEELGEEFSIELEPIDIEEGEEDTEGAAKEKKRGVFSRLFGRKHEPKH